MEIDVCNGCVHATGTLTVSSEHAEVTQGITSANDSSEYFVERYLEVSRSFLRFQDFYALAVIRTEGELYPSWGKALRLENLSRHILKIDGFN